jgi:uncharacterized protein YcgI (DUF1989 family)
MPFVDQVGDLEKALHTFDVPGAIVREWIVPAKEYAAFLLNRGQVLRLVDLEGKQVPDVVWFNQRNLKEHLNLGNSQQIAQGRRLRLVKGDLIVSQVSNPMMTILDYTNENNLSYSSMCSEETNKLRYGIGNTRNCRDNIAMALRPWGMDKFDVPDAFKPFMNVEIDADGNQEIKEATSEPGDYYDLRAEMDLLVAFSNCPQELNACNGWEATATGVILYEPR